MIWALAPCVGTQFKEAGILVAIMVRMTASSIDSGVRRSRGFVACPPEPVTAESFSSLPEIVPPAIPASFHEYVYHTAVCKASPWTLGTVSNFLRWGMLCILCMCALDHLRLLAKISGLFT